MFRIILILVILGAIGYFVFEKFSTDKTNGESLFAKIGVSSDVTATSRAVRAVTQENYDYEHK